MKRSNIFLLIILCLAVAGAIFLIFRIEKDKAPEKETIPAYTATPVPTATPTPEPTATPTPQPTATAAPASTASPTPTVVVTLAPLPSGTPEPNYPTEGTFRSDTGTWLNIIVKWKIVEEGGETKLQMDAYTESYSLITNRWENDVEFIVGASVVYDTSGALNVASDHGLVETKIGTASIPVESGTKADVFVTWRFNGEYGSPAGKKQIDSILAEGEIYIP